MFMKGFDKIQDAADKVFWGGIIASVAMGGMMLAGIAVPMAALVATSVVSSAALTVSLRTAYAEKAVSWLSGDKEPNQREQSSPAMEPTLQPTQGLSASPALAAQAPQTPQTPQTEYNPAKDSATIQGIINSRNEAQSFAQTLEQEPAIAAHAAR